MKGCLGIIRSKAVLGNATLIILAVGIAFLMMEVLLRTYPNLVPREIRVNPPVRRVQAFKVKSHDVKLSHGDLYYWMSGAIAPVPPNQDKIVARVYLTYDSQGFRNALPEKETYGIVTLGDSFTDGLNAPTPWPQQLANYTEIDVLNLGEAGSGPQIELEALRQYGLEKRPQWVIMAYFEGNDLHDAAAYEQANPFLLARLGRYMLTRSRQVSNKSRFDRTSPLIRTDGATSLPMDPSYQYPVTVTIDDTTLEMAFFNYYISWLSVNREAIELSQNYRLGKRDNFTCA